MSLRVSHSKAAFSLAKVQSIVNSARKQLSGIRFDSFAFTGVSGALLAPILARELRKGLIVVRKTIEDTHSCIDVEGNISSKKYIIVDDFIDCGDTVQRIIDKISDSNWSAKCAGIALYMHNRPVGYWKKQFNVPVYKLNKR